MDLETLFHRNSLAGSPISLLIRPGDVAPVWQSAVDLLEGCGLSGEVIVLSDEPIPSRLPARSRGIRIRWIPWDSDASSPDLAALGEMCRWPSIIMTDAAVTLKERDLAELVDRLNFSDIVVGIRSRRERWLLRPFAWGLRMLLGVPVRDPLCPIRGFRKRALEGVVIQSAGAMVDVEVLAKLTFRESLFDEYPLRSSPKSPGLVATVLRSLGRDRALWLRPKFWKFDRRKPVFPPVLADVVATVPSEKSAEPATNGNHRWNHPRHPWGPIFPKRRLV
ncbi:hypothetical protein Pan216_24160 [Planctomycetes bacterium Pan216]|uniref:Glycosyl transferase family 2 n=1 Tax=Kolteria novifilia TaxID=2527975 RepID=A0A518B3K5_9BACT|nr:hypothetical protein Pan216_24160 [Planctomycetes bacterium Pan216]